MKSSFQIVTDFCNDNSLDLQHLPSKPADKKWEMIEEVVIRLTPINTPILEAKITANTLANKNPTEGCEEIIVERIKELQLNLSKEL
jgi:hypothetical protein